MPAPSAARLAAGGTVAGAAAGLGVLGSVAYVRAAARGRLFTEDDVPAMPVGLVLGAQVYPSGRPSRFLARRLDLALRLWRRGRVRVVLVSGDSTAAEYDEPVAMQRYLIDQGVPAGRIVVDEAGFDTYDSCVRAREVFGLSQLMVITQTYHLPRAVGTAVLVGLDAWGVGDSTVADAGAPWRKGVARDQVACVKTVLDLSRRRRPTLGPSRAVEVAAALAG